MDWSTKNQEWMTHATRAALTKAGCDDVRDLWIMSDEAILSIKGVGPSALEVIRLMENVLSDPEAVAKIEEAPVGDSHEGIDVDDPTEEEPDSIKLSPFQRAKSRATMAYTFIIAHLSVAQNPRRMIVDEAFEWADTFIDRSEGVSPDKTPFEKAEEEQN